MNDYNIAIDQGYYDCDKCETKTAQILYDALLSEHEYLKELNFRAEEQNTFQEVEW